MSHDTAKRIVILVICAVGMAVGMVLYDWANKQLRGRSKSAYWRSCPTSLQIVGYLFVMAAAGLATNALPRLWPEWLRTLLFVAAVVVIYYGGRILCRFGRGGSS